MHHLIALATLLPLLAIQEKKTDETFAASLWSRWEPFAEGSSVTTESEFDGKKSTNTETLVAREKDKLTLESRHDTTIKGETKPIVARQFVRPPVAPTPKDPNAACPGCKKPLKDHKATETTDEKETLTIAKQKLECVKRTFTSYDCQDKTSSTVIQWLSKEVPGMAVKFEATGPGDSKRTFVVTEFVKK